MTTTAESHPAEQEPKPINWKAWLSLPHVELWQGVALVNGIDPNSLRRSGNKRIWADRESIFESASFSSARKCAAFHEAMGWAERAANCGGPIHLRVRPITKVVRHDVTVSLAEVVAYFAGMDWPGIPAPLLGAMKLLEAGVGVQVVPPAPAVANTALAPTRPAAQPDTQPASKGAVVETATEREDRRYRKLVAMGGGYIKVDQAWRVTGSRGLLAKLIREVKVAGEPMSDEKNVREGLQKAATRAKNLGFAGHAENSVFGQNPIAGHPGNSRK